MDVNAFFGLLCRTLQLGTPTAAPAPLSGGYTHRMYALTTTRGRYAVKLLNPEIMARPDALDNYRRAEAHEARMEAAGLPILPARTIHGRKMHQVDGRYVYVFDYFDGAPLKDGDITPAHCRRMGTALARIHALDAPAAPAQAETGPDIDWAALTAALLQDEDSHRCGELMQQHLPLLHHVTRSAIRAAQQLPRRLALCHNDMDAKNVLWQGDAFRIIDLECLDYADPLQEMLDLALSWGGWPLDRARFTAFVQGYTGAGGALPRNAALLYDSRRNHIDWLAYNARRCLFPDPQERAMGRTQIYETIDKIGSDQRCRTAVLDWMREMTGSDA